MFVIEMKYTVLTKAVRTVSIPAGPLTSRRYFPPSSSLSGLSLMNTATSLTVVNCFAV